MASGSLRVTSRTGFAIGSSPRLSTRLTHPGAVLPAGAAEGRVGARKSGRERTDMDLGLKGRRALVMGGTKGLGRSIADALAAEGASLVISGRDQGRLNEAAAALKGAGAASAVGVVADVASSADMDKL